MKGDSGLAVGWVVQCVVCGVVSAWCGQCVVWSVRGVVSAWCGQCVVWSVRGVVSAWCGQCMVWSVSRIWLVVYGGFSAWICVDKKCIMVHYYMRYMGEMYVIRCYTHGA